MDNFRTTSAESSPRHGFSGAMSERPKDHFGELQRRLREERGLTQERLAAAVGSSEATIQRAEKARECVYRRSTATNVLRALHKEAPVPDTEARSFLIAAGLSENFLNALKAMAPVIEQSLHNPLHTIVDVLATQVGAERVRIALESLAAAWGVSTVTNQRASVRFVDHRREEGMDVRIYAPPQTPTASPSPNKRATPKRGTHGG